MGSLSDFISRPVLFRTLEQSLLLSQCTAFRNEKPIAARGEFISFGISVLMTEPPKKEQAQKLR
jgi:hypothetical protein